MTFKALLYKCYAKGDPIGAGSKGQTGPRAPWTICSLPTLGSNNKYSNKIIAKLLHLR